MEQLTGIQKTIFELIAIASAGFVIARSHGLWNFLRFHLWNKRNIGKVYYLYHLKPFDCTGCISFWIGFIVFSEEMFWMRTELALVCFLMGKILERYA